jgi:DNA repair protein RadC
MENSFYQLAEIEISYRPKFKAADRPQIDSSQKAYHLLLDNWNKDRIELLEEFKIILLNRRNRVLGIVNISQGGIAGTMADPKIIFAIALKACASGIILSHSHPSGEASPSEKTQNILTDAFCSFSIEESDFFLNQIQQIQ